MEQREGESRISYLVRVLNAYMKDTPAGSYTIEYDDATCDGWCLVNDIAADLNIAV